MLSLFYQFAERFAVGKKRFHINRGELDAIFGEYKERGVFCEDGTHVRSACKRHHAKTTASITRISVPSSDTVRALSGIVHMFPSELKPAQCWSSSRCTQGTVLHQRFACGACAGSAGGLISKDGAASDRLSSLLSGQGARDHAVVEAQCNFSVTVAESLDPRNATVITIHGAHAPSCLESRSRFALHPELEAKAISLVRDRMPTHSVITECSKFGARLQARVESEVMAYLGIDKQGNALDHSFIVDAVGTPPRDLSSVPAPLRIRRFRSSLKPLIEATTVTGSAAVESLTVSLTGPSPQRRSFFVPSMAGHGPARASRRMKRQRHRRRGSDSAKSHGGSVSSGQSRDCPNTSESGHDSGGDDSGGDDSGGDDSGGDDSGGDDSGGDDSSGDDSSGDDSDGDDSDDCETGGDVGLSSPQAG